MYCPECGQLLSENQKFCSECGTQIPLKKPETNHRKPEKSAASNFSAYIDKYISKETTFTSASSLINGARPLRFKWITTAASSLLGCITIGLGGIIIGFLVSIIAFRIILPILLIKRGSKKYQTFGKTIDIDDLAFFLERNLDSTYFTAWQRGTPSAFGLKNTGLLIVECLFNNKTYHRIIFDQDELSFYKIETSGVTAKERLKDGGDRNPNTLYKSDWIVRPILEAATKYYFRYVAH